MSFKDLPKSWFTGFPKKKLYTTERIYEEITEIISLLVNCYWTCVITHVVIQWNCISFWKSDSELFSTTVTFGVRVSCVTTNTRCSVFGWAIIVTPSDRMIYLKFVNSWSRILCTSCTSGFSIVLRHSNYNNRIISIVTVFLRTPCRWDIYVPSTYTWSQLIEEMVLKLVRVTV